MPTQQYAVVSLASTFVLCSLSMGHALAMECTPAEKSQARVFIDSAMNTADEVDRSLLLRKSVKACENFETWYRYGDAEFKLDNWERSTAALERARDLLTANSGNSMSERQIEILAVGNALLAESYYREERLARAMVTMEEARSGFGVINRATPVRLIELQAKIDDSLVDSDATVLARSFKIQQDRATRGLGVRPRVREVPPEDDVSASEASSMVALYEGTEASPAVVVAPDTQVIQPESEPVTESRINIPVLFGYDSFELEPGSLNTVRQIAGALEILNLKESATVRIVGHTDSQGSATYNQRLSERRAEAVKEQIRTLLDISIKLESIGMGEKELRYLGTGKNDHRRNRRVEIVVIQ